MTDSWKKSEIERLMRAHGLQLSKRYGQNFLTDKNIIEKIADAAELTKDDSVIEIGPGLGALTPFLAQAAARVTAVEIDGRLIPALSEATAGLDNLTIINEDFMKYEWAAPAKIAGNLPYYITTPIIAKLLEQNRGNITLSVLMMQKEVAGRLLSPPGNKTYGAISVLVQYYTEPENLFDVSKEVFYPKPKVDSSVIRLRPKDLSADNQKTAALMFRLVRAGFDMRRKTLRNSLASAGFPEQDLLSALAAAGIDPSRRAETLSPRDFYALAASLC